MVSILVYIKGRTASSVGDIARIFQNGRSQAVRLPAAYRFDTTEVYIRRDEATGDVILSRRPSDWEGLFRVIDEARAESAEFLRDRRDQQPQERELF